MQFESGLAIIPPIRSLRAPPADPLLHGLDGFAKLGEIFCKRLKVSHLYNFPSFFAYFFRSLFQLARLFGRREMPDFTSWQSLDRRSTTALTQESEGFLGKSGLSPRTKHLIVFLHPWFQYLELCSERKKQGTSNALPIELVPNGHHHIY